MHEGHDQVQGEDLQDQPDHHRHRNLLQGLPEHPLQLPGGGRPGAFRRARPVLQPKRPATTTQQRQNRNSLGTLLFQHRTPHFGNHHRGKKQRH